MLTKPFRRISIEQCEPVANNNDGDTKPLELKCDEQLRTHFNDLSKTRRDRIVRLLRSTPSASDWQPDAYENNPKGIVDYQNDVINLKSRVDEISLMIIDRNDKIEKLKRALTRSKESKKQLRRSLEKLKAENQEITADRTATTLKVGIQADTIDKYERFCSALVSELSCVVGHQNERCSDPLCRGFLRQTLCNTVEVCRRLSRGDRLQTGDDHADFAAKLQMISAPSTQDGCTQTADFANEPRMTSVSSAQDNSTQTADYSDRRLFLSVHVQTTSSGAVGESVSVQTDSLVRSSVSVQTNTLYCQTVGVQTNFDQVDSSEMENGTGTSEEYSSNIDIVSELLDKFGHDTRMHTSRYNIKILLGKAQTQGFQKLTYQELAFLHRNILAQSAKYFTKYTPLLELAKKKYPSLKSNMIKYKYDIVHIFATLDAVLEVKNKELASERNNSTKNQNKFKALLDEQTQKRISAENKVLEVKAENARLAKRNM